MNFVKWSRVVLAGSLMAFGFANAADYPDHPINGIIAWGAGGGTDTVSRLTTPLAEKALGKPIILANKTGATGAIAAQAVASAKADGYTLMFHAENPQLYQVLGLSELSYDDFDPVMLFVQGSTVIVVPKDSPLKTYDDLIKAAKANSGQDVDRHQRHRRPALGHRDPAEARSRASPSIRLRSTATARWSRRCSASSST